VAQATIQALQFNLATSEALRTIPPPEEVFDEDLATVTAQRDTARATIEALQSQLATSEAAVAPTGVSSQSSGNDNDEASARTTPSPMPSEFTMYTSPNFGFELSWRDPWSETHREASAQGETVAFDQLVLSNGVSSVAFTGTTSFAGDSQQCIEGVVEGIRGRTGNSDVQPVEVAVGDAIPAGDRSQASRSYVYTTEVGGSPIQRIAYITCITLSEDRSNLVVIHSAPIELFAGQVMPRDELGARLILPD
jgi:hypothetical protein